MASKVRTFVNVDCFHSKRMSDPFPLEYLPQIPLHKVVQYLPSQSKNSLRLTSRYFAETISSLDHHYQSGKLGFSPQDFDRKMRAVTGLLTRNDKNPVEMDVYLTVLNHKHYTDNEAVCGEIKFSRRNIHLELDLAKFDLNKPDEAVALRSLISDLQKRKVVQVSVELILSHVADVQAATNLMDDISRVSWRLVSVKMWYCQRDLDFVLSDRQLPHLTDLDLGGFHLRDHKEEMTVLVDRVSPTLSSLSIRDKTGLSRHDVDVSKLSYLHLGYLLPDNLHLVLASAPNLKVLSLKRAEEIARLTSEFPALRALRSEDQSILHLLPKCGGTLECLMIRAKFGFVDESLAADVVSRCQLPKLQQLCINTGLGEVCMMLMNKCCSTLKFLEVSSFLGKKDIEIRDLEFPCLEELTLMGSDAALINILATCRLPRVQVVRMLRPSHSDLVSLPGHLAGLKTLKKLVVASTEEVAISRLRNHISCQLELTHFNTSSQLEDDASLKLRYL